MLRAAPLMLGLLAVLVLSPLLILLPELASAAEWWAAFRAPVRLLRLFGNSALVALGTAALATGCGALLGLLVFRSDLCGHRALALLLIGLAAMPLYVSTGAWISWVGLDRMLDRMLATTWVQGLAWAPLVALFMGAHFRYGSPGSEDAARLETGLFGLCRHVLFPGRLAALGFCALAVAMLSLSEITVTDILRVRTYGEEVFTQFQRGMDPGRPLMIALPLVLLTAVLVLAATRLLRMAGLHFGVDFERHRSRLPLGRARGWISLLTWLLFVGLWLLPLAFLLRAIRSPQQMVQALGAVGDEVLGSLSTAPPAGVLAALLAFPLALGWLHARGGSWIPKLVLLVLLSVPAPVLAHGLISLFNRAGALGWVYDSRLMLVFAGALRALPYALMLQLPALAALPRELQQFAALEGASLWQRIWRIWLPLSRPALVASGLVGFVLALGELGASFLVAPPGVGTLALHFFSQIHFGLYPDAASICLLLLFVAVGTALLLAALLRRWLQS